MAGRGNFEAAAEMDEIGNFEVVAAEPNNFVAAVAVEAAEMAGRGSFEVAAGVHGRGSFGAAVVVVVAAAVVAVAELVVEELAGAANKEKE